MKINECLSPQSYTSITGLKVQAGKECLSMTTVHSGSSKSFIQYIGRHAYMHACVLTDKKTDTTETLILNPNPKP